MAWKWMKTTGGNGMENIETINETQKLENKFF